MKQEELDLLVDEVLKYVLNSERDLIPKRDACDLSDKYPFVQPQAPIEDEIKGIQTSSEHVGEHVNQIVDKIEMNADVILSQLNTPIEIDPLSVLSQI